MYELRTRCRRERPAAGEAPWARSSSPSTPKRDDDEEDAPRTLHTAPPDTASYDDEPDTASVEEEEETQDA